jgi:hypothetical protein
VEGESSSTYTWGYRGAPGAPNRTGAPGRPLRPPPCASAPACLRGAEPAPEPCWISWPAGAPIWAPLLAHPGPPAAAHRPPHDAPSRPWPGNTGAATTAQKPQPGASLRAGHTAWSQGPLRWRARVGQEGGPDGGAGRPRNPAGLRRRLRAPQARRCGSARRRPPSSAASMIAGWRRRSRLGPPPPPPELPVEAGPGGGRSPGGRNAGAGCHCRAPGCLEPLCHPAAAPGRGHTLGLTQLSGTVADQPPSRSSKPVNSTSTCTASWPCAGGAGAAAAPVGRQTAALLPGARHGAPTRPGGPHQQCPGAAQEQPRSSGGSISPAPPRRPRCARPARALPQSRCP